MEGRTFHWADYLVFSLALLISASIGIFYRLTGQKQRTTREFLLGGQTLKPVPVALSLQASFMSAVSILGLPAEIYTMGSMYAWILACYLIGFPIAAHVFVPIIHKLNMTSAYQLLEMRFNKYVRLAGSLTFSIMMLLYMAIVLYAPALALSQVTGLSLWISIATTGLVCTFYTAMGGLRAVVWTDTFQMLTIYAGILALLVIGTMEVGGIDQVFQVAWDGGRIDIIDWDPDPRTRHTFWTQVIGGAVMTLTLYAANQTMIQRYIAIQKTRDAQLAVYIAMGSSIVANSLLTLLGFILYAYYAYCDPLDSKLVKKADQIVPLFVMTVLGPYPGLAGLFVACIISAALSTVSSGVNSLAAVVLEDIVKPIYQLQNAVTMREDVATLISKLLAVIFGLATIALGFAASVMGPKVLQIALSIFGVVGGPLLGVFILALFCPWANSAGALCGLLSSLVLCFWMQLGAIFELGPVAALARNITGCLDNSTTQTVGLSGLYISSNITYFPTVDTSTQPVEPVEQNALQDLYSVSYMWYSVIGTLAVLVAALPVSAITGFNKAEKTLWTEQVRTATVCFRKQRSNKRVYQVSQDTAEAVELQEDKRRLNLEPIEVPIGVRPEKYSLDNGHN